MKLRSWLEESPFTLSLSSGFFGFYAHAGFLRALEEAGLAPRAYTGASAGAIVAGAAAAGLRAIDIEKLVLSVRREDFWDPGLGLGLVRGAKLEKILEDKIGADFSVLQKPLRIATFDLLKRKTVIFDSGPLAKVIRASCSVPLMFHPVRIGRSLYLDGGVLDKMALEGVAENEKVLCHYLDGENGYERYERRRDEKKREQGLRRVVLKGLVRAGPRTMDRGPEIIEMAYRQTKLELEA